MVLSVLLAVLLVVGWSFVGASTGTGTTDYSPVLSRRLLTPTGFWHLGLVLISRAALVLVLAVLPLVVLVVAAAALVLVVVFLVRSGRRNFSLAAYSLVAYW